MLYLTHCRVNRPGMGFELRECLFCICGSLAPKAIVAVLVLWNTMTVDAQTRRIEPAEVQCPSVLGVGVDTDRIYCDVLVGTDISEGILVIVPPHRGPATLTFMLYGRHTYSAEAVARGRGYARYLATTAVATSDSVLARPIVLAEFHNIEDLADRVSGGAGPSGVKAVAPVGGEGITVTVPANVNEVSIVGLELEVERVDGREAFGAPGRPIAVLGDVQVEYRAR